MIKDFSKTWDNTLDIELKFIKISFHPTIKIFITFVVIKLILKLQKLFSKQKAFQRNSIFGYSFENIWPLIAKPTKKSFKKKKQKEKIIITTSNFDLP